MAPHKEQVVRGVKVIVMLIAGKAEASIAVVPPPGKGGGLLPPRHVSVRPFLDGGLSEADTVDRVMELVVLGVEACA
jgi:hypothetical protein